MIKKCVIKINSNAFSYLFLSIFNSQIPIIKKDKSV